MRVARDENGPALVRRLRHGVEHARGPQQHADWRSGRRGRLRGHGDRRGDGEKRDQGDRLMASTSVHASRTRPPGAGRRTPAATPPAGSRHLRRGRRSRAAPRAGLPHGRRRRRCGRCRRSESWPLRSACERSRAISKMRGSGFSTPSSCESKTMSTCGSSPTRPRIRRTLPLEFDTTTSRQPVARSRLRAVDRAGGDDVEGALPIVERHQFLDRLCRGRLRRDSRQLEYPVEVDVTAPAIVCRLDGGAVIEFLLHVGLGPGEGLGGHVMPRRASASARRGKFGVTITPPASRNTVR